MKRAPVTTHILDLVTGRPSSGVTVALFFEGEQLAQSKTNEDGRIASWNSDFGLEQGRYRLEFEVGPWFKSLGREAFYEEIQIAFLVSNVEEHFHVPLLLSPHGYSTYRGS